MKKFNRILAGVLATAMTFTAFAVPASATETTVFEDGFENGIGDWIPRGEETLDVVTDVSHNGQSSIAVTDRNKVWNGAQVSLDGKVSAGVDYNFSAFVMYNNSYEGSHGFSINLQYDQNGTTQYVTVANATANKGAWTEIKGSAVIPAGAENVGFYIQTAYTSNPTENDLIDFYVDDVTITEPEPAKIQTDIAPLKSAYETYFKIGTAVTAGELASPTTQDFIKFHCNSLTPGNELKPDAILDQKATLALVEETGDQTQIAINLRAADSILKFAAENKIPVRGHTLVWHSQTPDWFFKENYDANADWVTPEVMDKRMENYIKTVMETLAKDYPDVDFYAWDVANEVFKDDGNHRDAGSSYTNGNLSAWVSVYGDNSFVEKAFTYARKYAPKGCKLYYNDFNEYIPSKTNAICKLYTDLSEKGLIDGIGMQSHLDRSYPSASMYKTALQKFAETGADIQITELDATTYDNNETELKLQADYYRDIMTAVREVQADTGAISSLTIWGIRDSMSWRAKKYPLLFDKDYQAKPAYYAIVENIEPLETTTTTETQPTETTEPTTTKPTTTEPTDTQPTETTEPTTTEPAGTETTTDTQPTETTTSNPDDKNKYDVNKDGKVNISDAIVVASSIVNGEKTYNIADLMAICRYIAGLS